MKLLLVCLLAVSSLAFAAVNPPSGYHDGTLVSFHAASGDNCTVGSAEKGCDDEYSGQYTVKSEGIVYILTPVRTTKGSFTHRATLGLGKTLNKNSSLYHQAPGTALQLRDDGKHTFVKVGDRESMYDSVEAR
jgi:hypothetical protein